MPRTVRAVGHSNLRPALMDVPSLPQPDAADWAEQFQAALDEQRRQLEQFLRAGEERFERAEQDVLALVDRLAADADGDQDDPYRRRCETAMEDVRQLRAENAELRRQLDRASADALAAEGGSGSSSGLSAEASGNEGPLDWEAQKQRMLAALEAEGARENDENQDEPDRQRRREIQEVVERTDRVIAEKNRELDEMKQLLADQSSSVGSLAVGAAAVDDLFDKDEIIREERQNLARLREQWHEKLRAAEVEISMERAKLARERAELEERLQAVQSRPPADGSAGEASAPGSGARGRWLAQLGLNGKSRGKGA